MGDSPNALGALWVRVGNEVRQLDTRQCLTFGRDDSCDWALVDERVSRRHAFLFWNGCWTFKDLASTNGMFVEGSAVGIWQLGASAGMSVRLGDPSDGPKVEFSIRGMHTVTGFSSGRPGDALALQNTDLGVPASMLGTAGRNYSPKVKGIRC